MRTLVVLPTFNEAANIVHVLRRVRTAIPAADVLVVDDASPDGTAEIARTLDAELGGIDVLERTAKLGLGSAYREGFAEGLRRGSQILVEMDSDLSHDPSALPALLSAVQHGADLAIGSRYVPGGSILHWSSSRRRLSQWGNTYARWALRLPLADLTSGFRAYHAQIVAKLDLAAIQSEGYSFQIEMAYRVAKVGGAIVEVPIEFADRERGVSKMSLGIVAEALLRVTWWGTCELAARYRPVSG